VLRLRVEGDGVSRAFVEALEGKVSLVLRWTSSGRREEVTLSHASGLWEAEVPESAWDGTDFEIATKDE
jgi:hypothetical protein